MDSECTFLALFSIIMGNNSERTRIIKRDKSRNQARYRKEALRKKRKSKAELKAEARIKNIEIYENWNLTQKYDFALAGYEFPNNPGQKAIVLDKTDMVTDPGYNGCIRAGTAFDELPAGFIILFSHWDITDEELFGDPAKYQVWLPGDRYLQPHPNPVSDYGLGQFINCCLPSKSSITHLNGPNMEDAQCELKHARRDLVTTGQMEISPAYVRTMRRIKQGQELFLPTGYGVAHRI